MKIYGVVEFPELNEEKEDEDNNQNIIINNKILTISNLEINFNKGETIEYLMINLNYKMVNIHVYHIY